MCSSTSTPARWQLISALTAKLCLLCGVPHKRHYADGGVMRPVWLFGLVGVLLVVILSA